MSALSWYQLGFPNDLDSKAVLDLFRSLAMRPRRGPLLGTSPVIFEVRADRHGLSHWLGVSESSNSAVLAQLHVHVPNIRVSGDDDRPNAQAHRVWELRLSSHRRSLRTDASEHISSALLASMQGHRPNEAVVLQWIVGPWLPRQVVKPANAREARSWIDIGSTDSRVPNDSEEALSLRKKQTEPVFGVVGRVAVVADDRGRKLRLLKQIVGALQLARQPGTGLVHRFLPASATRRRFRRFAVPNIAWPCSLNAAELVGVIGWPVGHPVLAGLTYAGGRQLPAVRKLVMTDAQLAADRTLTPPRARVVGKSTYPGLEGYLTLPAREALQHCLIVGPTGSGKSELLAQLILQDINAGRAVVAIDPKGSDLIEAVIDRMPEHRLRDVVLIDPAERIRPVGLNVLAGTDPELVADQIEHIFTEIYGVDGLGPRSRDILHSSALTLALAGGNTICDLPALLTNPAMRRRVLAAVHDPLTLGPFWRWFESTVSDTERATVVAPLQNKLRQFQKSALRNIVGQSSPGFAMRDVFTKRRILLVSLGKGVIGPQSAQLVGALIVSQLWNATLSRSAIAPERRHPVMVYLDEFADVVKLPTSLGDVLAQARGLGVGVTLAAQHAQQLPASLRADALANTRSKIVFQLGSDDGALFARQLGGGLEAVDIQSLGRFEIYASLAYGSRTTAPASAVTLPLPRAQGMSQRIRAASREAFGRDAGEIKAALLARSGYDEQPDGPVGRTGRKR